MHPSRLNRAKLAEFGKNMSTQIAAGKVIGLLPAQKDSFAQRIAVASQLVQESDVRTVELLAAYRQAVEQAQQARFDLLRLIQDMKNAMRSVGSEGNEYVVVGFEPPVIGRTPVTPQRPDELSAAGFSNGVNKLKFTGNNLPGRVIYVIEACIGDSTEYAIIGATHSQRWQHQGVTPGVPVLYRVRAQSTRGVSSEPSNNAAVYRE